jgi:hypothetical protein
MFRWLGAKLTALLTIIITVIVNKLWSEAKKPETIENENTPENIKRNWRQYVADQLRDKDRGH